MTYAAPQSEFWPAQAADQSHSGVSCGVKRQRQSRGATSYHAGLAAEDQICADYARRGFPLQQRRWRGSGGEIDVIVRDGEGLVFVEVKKSRNFTAALAQLGRRQMQRLYAAAEEYLGQMPRGALTEVRFDVALVNEQGELRIVENAFGHG